MRNTYIYGFNFDSKGKPQYLVSALTFSRLDKHPIDKGAFHYLGYKGSTAGTRNGYKVYKLGKNKKSIYEVKEPVGDGSSSSSASAAASAMDEDEDEDMEGLIPQTLSESVQQAGMGAIISSVIFGIPVVTGLMQDLVKEIGEIKEEIKKQEDLLPRGSYASFGESRSIIIALRRQLQDYETVLKALQEHQEELFAEGGGRVGVLGASTGCGRGGGGGGGGSNCTISRKSRRRKSRRRNTRRQRSRKNQRR